MIRLTVVRNQCRVEYDNFGTKRLKSEVAAGADGLIKILAKELDMSYNVAALVLMQACTVVHNKTAGDIPAENTNEEEKNDEQHNDKT